jgi:hypothetical protein
MQQNSSSVTGGSSGRKHRAVMWGLIGVNVALGMALLARFGHQSTAIAQVGRPSDYLMITGEINGNQNAVLYLLDTTNGTLGAMVFDPSRNRFDQMSPIDLNRQFDQVPAGGAPARGGNPRPGVR